MKSIAKYILAVVVLVLAAVGFWYMFQIKQNTPSQPAAAAVAATAPELSPEEAIAAAKESNSAGLSEAASEAAASSAAAQLSKMYSDGTYGFSFNYPNTFKVGSSADDSGTTVLVQDVSSHVGFQVYITPWNDPDTTFTAERVAQDLPNVQLRSAQNVVVGGSSAFAFLASDANFGDSRQVWFVHNGNLYQISAYSSQDPLLEKILGTWKFK